MNNADGNDFLDSILKFTDKIFKKRMSSVLQVATATVISINGDGVPTVRLLSSPSDGSEDFTAENESGKTLLANDMVRLYYWGTLSTAYVARKG